MGAVRDRAQLPLRRDKLGIMRARVKNERQDIFVNSRFLVAGLLGMTKCKQQIPRRGAPRNDKYVSEPESPHPFAKKREGMGTRRLFQSGGHPLPGFGETGRGCSSITALLLMQFLFL